MFWKIFAWTNLIAVGMLLISGLFFWDTAIYPLIATPTGFLQYVTMLVLNDIPLIIIPILFAYKIYNGKYLLNAFSLEIIFIFSTFYSTINVLEELIGYNFSSISGLVFDMFFNTLTILSNISFALYQIHRNSGKIFQDRQTHD